MTAWQMAAHTNSTRALGCRKVPITVGGGGREKASREELGAGGKEVVQSIPQLPSPL